MKRQSLDSLLSEFSKFMQGVQPYDYTKWKVNDTIAIECKKRLQVIADNLRLILAEYKNITIKIPDGVTYYPRRVWIGVMFPDENPTNGVYPLLGFSLDYTKVYVGCVDSIAHPQLGFSERFCSRHGISKEQEDALYDVDKFEDAHLSDSVHVFNIGSGIEESDLFSAFQKAIECYQQYRNKQAVCICHSDNSRHIELAKDLIDKMGTYADSAHISIKTPKGCNIEKEEIAISFQKHKGIELMMVIVVAVLIFMMLILASAFYVDQNLELCIWY